MTPQYILMMLLDQWWLCYPPGSGAYPAGCRHSWGSSGCTWGRTSTGTWAMWTWSLSAFLRGGQIHPVMGFVRERILILTHETNTHTHVPSTDKQTQSNTQIHTHRHTQIHAYSQTVTHKDTRVDTVFPDQILRSDWEWNANLMQIQLQDLCTAH